MECSDTVLLIASYLTKKDLVALSGVSTLCRKVVTAACISHEEKQYLVWPCLKEDYVELAPPSQILALGVLGNEQRLLVLIRCGMETSNLAEMECYLFTQLIHPDGSVSESQKELPPCFAFPTSSSRFLGSRFLVCTTREGDLYVFDCLIEALVELPFGIDGFYPSPDGERFLVDYDRHAYLCSTAAHVLCWWEMRHVEPKNAEVDAFHRRRPLHATQSSTLMETQLRAQICPLGGPSHATPSSSLSSPPPPLRYYLEASSVAWRTFWVGGSSALYAHEGGVVLLRPSTATPGQLEAQELTTLTPVSSRLVDSSCGDVAASPTGIHDEYAIVNAREAHLYTVDCFVDRPPEVRTIDLAHILPARVAVKAVRIAVCRNAYLVYLQHGGQDRVLLLSSDLTLTRWITIGRPSCFVLWRQQATLVTACLPDDLGESSHPLVEAVEGGLGCVYTFGMRLPDASSATATADPFVSAVKVITSAGVVELGGPGGDYKLPGAPQAFNGVEALSWIAFGVVSASLLWTLTALCYNGWWLHLQLLFWGKVA